MIISIIVLVLIFILIAIRHFGPVRLKIWQIMFGGAIALLITGQISISQALKAIDVDVMLFLVGVFIVGRALEESGYLAHFSYMVFKKAKTANMLVLFILLSMGLGSAFLMNDTLAIIGTPVMLLLARKHHYNAKVLLLALAFSITIGSVMSPIGNPQNLLIALHGDIDNPFITFFSFLFLPTMINLGLAFLLLKLYYPDQIHNNLLNHSQEPIKDQVLARCAQWSLLVLVLLIAVKVALVFLSVDLDFRLSYLALLAALPLLLFNSRRFEIMMKIDWPTLIFFASLFIVMASVWETGFIQAHLNFDYTSLPVILMGSVLASQLISNVPLVALYLPLLTQAQASTPALLALAAGSTVAGNLFILGAASNVIIIQHAEEQANETITFWEFARIGVPLTIINIIVYWIFLSIGLPT